MLFNKPDMTLKEKIIDKIEDFYYFAIYRPFNNLKWQILKRTTHKYHKIKIETLNKGFHEVDTLLMHSSFQILVDFVEKDWKIKSKEEFKEKILLDLNERQGEPEDWDFMSLDQNKNSMKIFELYLWWKNDYLKRPDLYDSEVLRSHTVELSEKQVDENGKEFYTMKPFPQEVSDEYDRITKTEEEWRVIDDQKLAELVSLRREIWY